MILVVLVLMTLGAGALVLLTGAMLYVVLTVLRSSEAGALRGRAREHAPPERRIVLDGGGVHRDVGE